MRYRSKTELLRRPVTFMATVTMGKTWAKPLQLSMTTE
jgi:hypothetical protein